MFEEYLKKAVAEKKVPNTLLLSEKKDAMWLAAELLCVKSVETHPDFHALVPEGKSGLHSIESIRDAIGTSHITPYSAPVKVFLITSAERMQPAAGNALLKTLEEPNLDSYWILVSERPQEILPTIVSRCAKVLRARETLPETPEFQEAFQEAKKLLLYLVEAKPTYPLLFQTLEKINEMLEDADPTSLFIALAEAYCALERKGSAGRWQAVFEEARLAAERNIKLSTCLEYFFLNVH